MITKFINERDTIELFEALKENIFEQLHPFDEKGMPRQVTVTPEIKRGLAIIAKVRNVPIEQALNGYIPMKRVINFDPDTDQHLSRVAVS